MVCTNCAHTEVDFFGGVELLISSLVVISSMQVFNVNVSHAGNWVILAITVGLVDVYVWRMTFVVVCMRVGLCLSESNQPTSLF